MASRFPTDTPEFEAIAQLIRCGEKMPREALDDAHRRLSEYTGPYIQRASYKKLPAEERVTDAQRPRLFRQYRRFQVALAKVQLSEMEEG